MGDSYAKILGESLTYMSTRKLKLGNNRLQPLGSLQIIRGMNSQVQSLDLSNNILGEEACHELCKLLNKRNS